MSGRVIAIGDIHGCASALDALLDSIEITPADTIVTLGDYIDRGPDSSAVIERLVDLISTCKLVPLLGNHELMMLEVVRESYDPSFWLSCGGDATVASYGGDLRNVPQHHRMFFKHCVRHHETDRHIFVHANYEFDLPVSEQSDSILFWEHIINEVPPPHVSGKRVFVGHTPQQDGMVVDMGHLVLLDTFCFGGKYLSAMDADTGFVWQADNHGKVRSFDNDSLRTS